MKEKQYLARFDRLKPTNILNQREITDKTTPDKK